MQGLEDLWWQLSWDHILCPQISNRLFQQSYHSTQKSSKRAQTVTAELSPKAASSKYSCTDECKTSSSVLPLFRGATVAKTTFWCVFKWVSKSFHFGILTQHPYLCTRNCWGALSAPARWTSNQKSTRSLHSCYVLFLFQCYLPDPTLSFLGSVVVKCSFLVRRCVATSIGLAHGGVDRTNVPFW